MNMQIHEDLIMLALAVSICSLIYTLVATRTLLHRQTALEDKLGQLPSAAEFANLRVQLAGLEAKQAAVLSEAHGALVAIRRVEDFLLKPRQEP